LISASDAKSDSSVIIEYRVHVLEEDGTNQPLIGSKRLSSDNVADTHAATAGAFADVVLRRNVVCHAAELELHYLS